LTFQGGRIVPPDAAIAENRENVAAAHGPIIA
jgi:hypothetical protein